MNNGQIFEIMKLISNSYGSERFKVTQEKIEAWNRIIGYIPYEDAVEATVNAIRKSDYPPTPSAIVREFESIEEERKKIESNINAAASFAVSSYPCSFNCPNAKEIFIDIVNGDEHLAESLKNVMLRDIDRMDHSQMDYIPIDEYLEKMNEKLRSKRNESTS